MAKDDITFFDTREDWSRRKHLILGQYLAPAAAKLRSVSPDGRVIILDGFAGPGQYKNGAPGSPECMGQLIDTVSRWRNPVDLRIYYVELNTRNYDDLERTT